MLVFAFRNTSASFPFNMFTNILEYGGPRATSRISEIFSSLGSFPCVHFIRFDMENHYLAKALCEGFEASKNSMISLVFTWCMMILVFSYSSKLWKSLWYVMFVCLMPCPSYMMVLAFDSALLYFSIRIMLWFYYNVQLKGLVSVSLQNGHLIR